MTADDVLFVLALLQRAEVDVWVGGGWGIDALIGEQTRDHRDLDLMHRGDQEAAVLAALSAAGFGESLNWRPIRFVMKAPDRREIDLHPLVFSGDGSAVQTSPEPQRPFAYPSSCFVTGAVQGTPVPCLSAEQQVYFHQGYQPTERDRRDMAQLRRVFGIATHF
ncbi:nucleotidyltransferase domain-containing protein [Streptomyces pseudovenezuelae]|uniref:Lincosamide nucleotidyltransferase A/C/D/E n=1 Tax=Streptomyces pseudovenezuelae TaxID=67350 RepID=A0ABT6LZR7_9ACTN|nr:amino acid transporter [Streptomyces pseudovenezuelae]MDH6221814.1 lincosamide nucleotidyltransferase A/C/D/E [Streptomyces pseudovenezuelae]